MPLERQWDFQENEVVCRLIEVFGYQSFAIIKRGKRAQFYEVALLIDKS